MSGTSKAARAAALNDAYISPFQEWDLSSANHTASTRPLAFAANDNRDGEAAVASYSLSCGCGCGKGWTGFFRDGVGDRARPPGVDTVTDPLLLDTIGGDSAGSAQPITIGATTYGVIEDFNDQDFFSVTLVAGQTYEISHLLHVGGTATGDGTLLSGVPLADAYIELYGPDGTTLLAEADGGSNTTPSGLDAKLYFTATTTGTYFINARSFDQDPTNGADGDHVGDYKLTVREVAPADAPLPRFYSAAGQAPNTLLDSLDWGSTWDHTVRNPDGDNGARTDNGVANGGTPITNTEYGITGKNVMKFYFARQGDVFLSDDPASPGLETTLQAREMLQWEKDAFLATMSLYEQVTDLQYVEVDNRADADIKIIIYQGTPGVGASLLGRMSPPGEQNEGQTEINAGDYRWTEEGVRPGGFFFPTLLHEWGHGHGMKHPHDTGGGGPIMRGAGPSEDPVEGAIGGAYGDFGLSQQMYTIMSYNDGWNETGGVGGRPAGHGGPSSGGLEMQADHYGWMGTLAALDIALLQDKYGVNEDWATGDDVYTIEDANGAGHYYRTIWDGGGNDEIRYVGSRDATIDLRAATLQYEEGGGGRVSFAMGAWTGFTIANGVLIERATGGDGNDILTGNAGDNVLAGGLGADRLYGGAAGEDTADYAGNLGAIWIDLEAGVGRWNYAQGDSLSLIDHVVGTDSGDRLFGAAGENRLQGGLGDDLLQGRFGADRLEGGSGSDTASYAGDYGGVFVNLATGLGRWNAADGDLLTGIENLVGSGYNDVLVGSAGDNRLEGGAGDDYLYSLGGNNILVGGLGADWLYGGGVGQDTADYAGAYGAIWIDLAAGVGRWNYAEGDILASIDNVVGTEWGDRLTGDAADNRLHGGLGADVLSGGAGADTADYAGNFGAVWIDLAGGRGRWNAAEGDSLSGIENATGTAWGDRLAGSAANNVLTGGAGGDTFLLAAGFGQDVITDFDGGGAEARDVISFRAGVFADFTDLMKNAVQQGNDVVISSGSNTLTLQGVQRSALHANDFDFAAAAPSNAPDPDAFVWTGDKDAGPQVLPAADDWTPMDKRTFAFDRPADLWLGPMLTLDQQGGIVDHNGRGEGWGWDGW